MIEKEEFLLDGFVCSGDSLPDLEEFVKMTERQTKHTTCRMEDLRIKSFWLKGSSGYHFYDFSRESLIGLKAGYPIARAILEIPNMGKSVIEESVAETGIVIGLQSSRINCISKKAYLELMKLVGLGSISTKSLFSRNQLLAEQMCDDPKEITMVVKGVPVGNRKSITKVFEVREGKTKRTYTAKELVDAAKAIAEDFTKYQVMNWTYTHDRIDVFIESTSMETETIIPGIRLSVIRDRDSITCEPIIRLEGTEVRLVGPAIGRNLSEKEKVLKGLQMAEMILTADMQTNEVRESIVGADMHVSADLKRRIIGSCSCIWEGNVLTTADALSVILKAINEAVDTKDLSASNQEKLTKLLGGRIMAALHKEETDDY